MLQNADDAGATEIEILVDCRHHRADGIFDKWEKMQGPALVIHNNKGFTQKDLSGESHLNICIAQEKPIY